MQQLKSNQINSNREHLAFNSLGRRTSKNRGTEAIQENINYISNNTVGTEEELLLERGFEMQMQPRKVRNHKISQQMR